MIKSKTVPLLENGEPTTDVNYVMMVTTLTEPGPVLKILAMVMMVMLITVNNTIRLELKLNVLFVKMITLFRPFNVLKYLILSIIVVNILPGELIICANSVIPITG